MLLLVVAVGQMAEEGHSDKKASGLEIRMKHRCVIEFLHAEKMAPNDTSQNLLDIYGHQTVGVNTVRWKVVHFSSGYSYMKD